MALNTYRCPEGHEQQELITISRFPVGTAVQIDCATCGARMEFVPEGMDHDLLPEDFVIDVGDGPIRLRSLHEVRQFERASRERFANGEGAPYNLREFSQNRSNRDVNTFGKSPFEPFETRNSRGLPYVTGGFHPDDY